MYNYYNSTLDLLRSMQYCIACEKQISCRFDLYLSNGSLNSSIHYELRDVAINPNIKAYLIRERQFLNKDLDLNFSQKILLEDKYALDMMPSNFYIAEMAQSLPHDSYHVNIGADCSCGRYSKASVDIINQQIIDLRLDYTTKSFTHNDKLYRIQINHYLHSIYLESSNNSKLFKLPHFEVDFTDIPKLVHKINTFTLFS